MRKMLAWLVHLYTASGLIVAAVATVWIIDGRPSALRNVLILFLIATLIDATDGFLARRAEVRRILPQFDGRRLDDIIDFHNYTSLPLLLIWRSELLPSSLQLLLLIPLLASAYGFSQSEAKSEDGSFVGFPSYWNVVAFYLYLLAPPTAFTSIILVVLALLTFVPIRYPYPTQPGRLNMMALIGGVIWAAILIPVLFGLVPDERTWLIVSLAYPAFYLGAAWWRAARGG